MTTYRMVDHGYAAFKKIMKGRDWVGRVLKHGEGGYVAVIGNSLSARAATERDAFEAVAAKALGYPDAETLKAKNRAVRSANYHYARQSRQMARHVVNEMLRGNFQPLDDALARSLRSK